MPRTKSPRKAYTPKAKLLPLGIRHELKTDLPLHLTWEALGTADLDLHHIEELFVHSEVLRFASPERAWRNKGTVLAAHCEAILRRYHDVGRFGVSGPEMVEIRAILAETIPYVRRLPNTAIFRALHGRKKS